MLYHYQIASPGIRIYIQIHCILYYMYTIEFSKLWPSIQLRLGLLLKDNTYILG